jgi:hypothetical protein
MICIIGHKGNMGRKYGVILDHIGVEWFGVDVDEGSLNREADGYIIATPTHTHCEFIGWLRDLGKPILCEKPVSKNLVELEKLLHACEKSGTKLQMVSQYDYLVKPQSEGPTVYDYYKHGGDGLYWDCINIIHHAKSTVIIKEKSPIWTCIINGHQLSLADMDRAYIDMIQDWLKNPRADYDRIWKSHDQVSSMEKRCQKF